jgi:hypothetical protein
MAVADAPAEAAGFGLNDALAEEELSAMSRAATDVAASEWLQSIYSNISANIDDFGPLDGLIADIFINAPVVVAIVGEMPEHLSGYEAESIWDGQFGWENLYSISNSEVPALLAELDERTYEYRNILILNNIYNNETNFPDAPAIVLFSRSR